MYPKDIQTTTTQSLRIARGNHLSKELAPVPLKAALPYHLTSICFCETFTEPIGQPYLATFILQYHQRSPLLPDNGQAAAAILKYHNTSQSTSRLKILSRAIPAPLPHPLPASRSPFFPQSYPIKQAFNSPNPISHLLHHLHQNKSHATSQQPDSNKQQHMNLTTKPTLHNILAPFLVF